MRTSIVGQFNYICESFPDKCAVVEEGNEVTFQQLDKMQKKIGKFAFGEETMRGQIIAVLLPKSAMLIASDMASLSAGGAFMNLDCKLPEERMKAILGHVNPKVILTNAELSNRYRTALSGQNVCCLAEEALENFECIPTDGYKEIIDTDPFCVINTSGSTGIPKAVVLNQKSFFDFLDWSCEVYHFDETERIGCLTPVFFDIYVFELCLLMCKGATMVLLDAKYAAFPMELVKKLEEEKITFIFWVPTIMVNIANMGLLDEITLPCLKKVWFAGEVFPTKQFNYWYDRLPDTQFSNLYGPIEITLDCTYYIIEKRIEDDEAIPIGYPCRNTDVLILNDDNCMCEPMEKGELCVRGTSLAMGYYNDWEKTKKVFVQNPLNSKYPEMIYRTGDIVYCSETGEIMFVGRKDSLIKHSGYRIELGEIEHVVVNQCGLVKNCCAIYLKEKSEIILCYESNEEITRIAFGKELGKYLPKYMIPKEFVQYKSMPQNANGKIDRFKLEQEIRSKEE